MRRPRKRPTFAAPFNFRSCVRATVIVLLCHVKNPCHNAARDTRFSMRVIVLSACRAPCTARAHTRMAVDNSVRIRCKSVRMARESCLSSWQIWRHRRSAARIPTRRRRLANVLRTANAWVTLATCRPWSFK